MGTIQTGIMAVSMCATSAKTRFRFALPPYTDLVNWAKLLHKMTRPIYGQALLIAAGHGVIVAIMTYRQQLAADKVHIKMMSEMHRR